MLQGRVSDSHKYGNDATEKLRKATQARDFLNDVSQLSRPQLTVDDAEFLVNYSLQAQKLTLRDVLLECSSPHKDALEEFPPSPYNSSSQQDNDLGLNPATPHPKANLSMRIIEAKQEQLQALIRLYESEILWLSSGSRLWFGQLTGQRISLLIDCSDAVCLSEIYDQYISALEFLFSEQLHAYQKVDVRVFGSEIINWDTDHEMKSSFVNWLNHIGSLGSCNLLKSLQILINTSSDVDTFCIILCSRPDQQLDIVYDYAVQLLSGRDQFKLHVAAINAEKDVQGFLQDLVREFQGHYHEIAFTQDTKQPIIQDSLIDKINMEKISAEKCIAELECIKSGIVDDSLIENLRHLSVIADWQAQTSSTGHLSPSHTSSYTIPYSSEDWLKKYGLDALGLNLYDVLAPDAYSQLSEYVQVIDKTAVASVYYNVMPELKWKDGSLKHLNVSVNKLKNYEADLKVYQGLLQDRLVWLQSGSRVPFGNLAEDRILVIIDSSLRASLHLFELKQHLKTLLHEQISQKKLFNLMSFAGESVSQWRKKLTPAAGDSLSEAWSWVLDIKPTGTCNLLSCLRNCLERIVTSGTKDVNEGSSSPLGIYLILSSIPDQDAESVCGYLEQILSGGNMRLHVILYQPVATDPVIEAALLQGVGRYGEEIDLLSYTKQLVESSGTGTLHNFKCGEFLGSNDHSVLVNEITKTKDYLNKVRQILEDYRIYCKRTVPVSGEDCTHDKKELITKPCIVPINPRPTLASISRMNYNSVKLKEQAEFNQPKRTNIQKRTRGLFLTSQTFYTGEGLTKGLYVDIVDLSGFVYKKPLIPSKEVLTSSANWLQKYGLQSLGLYNKKMFEESKDGYKHIASDGKLLHLSLSHQQLNRLLYEVKQVRQRYTHRLQWLLLDSRLVFGCLSGKKIVLVIDFSASMSIHLLKLKEHACDLINEQLCRRKSSFNILAYSTKLLMWRQEMSSCSELNRTEAQRWIRSLPAGGSSCLLEALKTSLKFQPDELYVVTDGETDHTHNYILSHLQKLRISCTHQWKLNTVCYHSVKSDCNWFLQELAHSTNARYHNYPVNSKALEVDVDTTANSTFELGDDLKLVAQEIKHADSVIGKLYYYLGRTF